MVKRFIIAFILVAAIAGGLVGFNLFRDRMIEQFFANMPVPTITVSTTEVEPSVWSPTISAIGTVSAANGVNLTVETSGIVKEVMFQANDRIEAGDVLVQLEDEMQQADLAAAETQAALDQQTLERARELQRRGVGSQSNLEAAEAAASASAAQVMKLQAALNQRQLRAPFSGTIGISQIELGQYLTPGEVVATLQDLDTMRVNFTVPEQRFGELAMGQGVRLGLTEDEMPFEGSIIGIDPKIDPSTRLVSVRAEISNPEGRLNPGQFVRVRVDLPAEDDVITVPQTALVTSLYGDYVYRLRSAEDNEAQEASGQDGEIFIAEQVFVQSGRRADGAVEIVEGLSAGDVVVNAGQNRLSNGARVRIDNTVQPVRVGAAAR
ncbi:efflux RND transporter periplasmic adaptor subunit [Chelativorans sp. Marseille-P2723]|uniref:efflux RND transporter periplasmic adaptor subunit n=1 Tax=Chelativorans sp. Marseille-P2723 TaxID=2709133 RepID=UPI00156F2BE6|nr:efflux RND transporter periplasmic adaptor subunit [Chelativorans sp. Marseille-P2723]